MITISPTTKEEISDFHIRAWHEANIEHYGREIEWDEQKFKFKAMENGNIIGSISGYCEAGVVYVGSLIVDKNYRKQGVGEKLMEEVVNFGKQSKAHKIWLTTGKNWQAVNFYEAIGFKKEAELPNHNFHQDFVVMSKFL